MQWVLAALAACYIGMALVVTGLLLGRSDTADAGAWLTLPLTLLFGAPLAALLLIGPAAFALRLASRLRGRMRR